MDKSWEEQLISEVQQRPALWQNDHYDHENNDVLEILWTEIAEKLEKPQTTIKNKWENLKTQFMTELQTEDSVTSSWSFFKNMEFLSITIEKEKKEIINLPDCVKSIESTSKSDKESMTHYKNSQKNNQLYNRNSIKFILFAYASIIITFIFLGVSKCVVNDYKKFMNSVDAQHILLLGFFAVPMFMMSKYFKNMRSTTVVDQKTVSENIVNDNVSKSIQQNPTPSHDSQKNNESLRIELNWYRLILVSILIASYILILVFAREINEFIKYYDFLPSEVLVLLMALVVMPCTIILLIHIDLPKATDHKTVSKKNVNDNVSISIQQNPSPSHDSQKNNEGVRIQIIWHRLILFLIAIASIIITLIFIGVSKYVIKDFEFTESDEYKFILLIGIVVVPGTMMFLVFMYRSKATDRKTVSEKTVNDPPPSYDVAILISPSDETKPPAYDKIIETHLTIIE